MHDIHEITPKTRNVEILREIEELMDGLHWDAMPRYSREALRAAVDLSIARAGVDCAIETDTMDDAKHAEYLRRAAIAATGLRENAGKISRAIAEYSARAAA